MNLTLLLLLKAFKCKVCRVYYADLFIFFFTLLEEKRKEVWLTLWGRFIVGIRAETAHGGGEVRGGSSSSSRAVPRSRVR